MQDSTTPAATSMAEERVVVERPPPGLARGRYAWPPWAIATLGITVILLAVLYLARRRLRKGGPR